MTPSNPSLLSRKLKNEEDKALAIALSKAAPLQVHRKTDYLPMVDQLSEIYSELAQSRKENEKQLRKPEEVRKHLDAIILDLWIAAKYHESPWRRISLNGNDYSKERRYSEKFLTYDLLGGVLEDIELLEYIEKSDYFHDRQSKKNSRQTRIKATDKLLNKLDFDIKKIERNPEVPEQEVIIKRGEDKSKKNINYIDDRFTIKMRENLHKYNNLLRKTSFSMNGVDLRYKYDTTSITVKRIFNGEAGGGGRFYYGFWENMSEEDRSKLQINNEEVCELDYANFQPRIVYARKGIKTEEDLYTIEGCKRDEVKKAFLVLFNCRSREHALSTIRRKGIKNAESLLQKIELKHDGIRRSFYNPRFGLYLQRIDSNIAEKIINNFTSKGIPCLPIHDSFIIAKSYESELRSVMEEVFYKYFHFKPKIK